MLTETTRYILFRSRWNSWRRRSNTSWYIRLSLFKLHSNLIIFAPRNEIELRNILYTAQLGLDLPIVIRYPRGRGNILDWQKPFKAIEIGKAQILKKSTETVVLCLGNMCTNALTAISSLPKSTQDTVGCIDMRFLKPIDEDILHEAFRVYKRIITVEDGTIKGGLGASVLEFASKNNYSTKVEVLGIPDIFPDHGTVEELQDLVGISAEKIKHRLLN